ncbi:MAG: outer membrane protein assembly factor BamB family protein [Leptospirales bacterium]
MRCRWGVVFGLILLFFPSVVPLAKAGEAGQEPQGFPGKAFFPQSGMSSPHPVADPVLPPVEWTQEGGGSTRNPVFPVSGAFPQSGAWERRFHVAAFPSGGASPENEDFYAGIVESGGILWLASTQGDLLAVGAGTGEVLWRRNLGGPLFSSPVTGSKTLYTVSAYPGVTLPHLILYSRTRRLIRGNGSERVWALSRRTGKSRWSVRLKGGVVGSPVLLPHTLMVATGRGHLIFLDRRDGHLVLDLPVDSRSFGWASPVEADRQVVLAQENPPLYQAISLDGPRRVWRFQLKGTRTWDHFFIGTPVLSGGVFIGVLRTHHPLRDVVVALDFRTGSLRWNVSFPAGQEDGVEDHCLPVLSDGVVYVPSGPARALTALNVQTGQTLWMIRLPEAPETGGAVIGHLLLLPLPSGTILSIERQSGVVVAREKVAESFGPHPPVVIGSRLFFAGRDGLVKARPIDDLGKKVEDLAEKVWEMPGSGTEKHALSHDDSSPIRPS